MLCTPLLSFTLVQLLASDPIITVCAVYAATLLVTVSTIATVVSIGACLTALVASAAAAPVASVHNACCDDCSVLPCCLLQLHGCQALLISTELVTRCCIRQLQCCSALPTSATLLSMLLECTCWQHGLSGVNRTGPEQKTLVISLLALYSTLQRAAEAGSVQCCLTLTCPARLLLVHASGASDICMLCMSVKAYVQLSCSSV